MSTETVTYLLKLRDKFNKPLGIANKGVTSLDQRSAAASVSIGRMGAALGALGILAAGKAILQAGMNMEQTRVAFATFLGDADKANNVIAQLNEFSNITPFNNDEVIKSGRVLLAAQLPAEKLTETLRKIGDVAAGSQVPLNELTSIYAKILNKGKVQAEELNQLSERGIPILQVLADQYGVTTQEILKMGSEGTLTADVVGKAFSKMSGEGGIFFNLMEKQSATAAGKLSTLQGSLGLLAAELGEKANPAVGGLLTKLIALVNMLKDNQETVILVAKTVGLMTVAFLAYKATVIATQKATLIFNAVQKASVITNIFFTKGLKKARVAMRLFNVTAKASPIGLIVSALVLAIPLFIKLTNSVKKVSARQKVLNNVSKQASEIFAKEASRVNVLKNTLEKGNVTQKERGDIIKEINANYGPYLDKLLTEKSTDEDIAAALEKVNAQLRIKARLQAIDKQIAITSDKEFALEQIRDNKRKLAARATEGFINKARLLFKLKFKGAASLTGEMTKAEAELEHEIGNVREELDELFELQKKISKEEIKTNKKITTTTTLDDKTKKRLETGIRAGAPKIININIGNLVENFEIKTEQFKQAPIRVKEEMTKVLLDAINDAALLQR